MKHSAVYTKECYYFGNRNDLFFNCKLVKKFRFPIFFLYSFSSIIQNVLETDAYVVIEFQKVFQFFFLFFFMWRFWKRSSVYFERLIYKQWIGIMERELE